jgi:hypothetical protein
MNRQEGGCDDVEDRAHEIIAPDGVPLASRRRALGQLLGWAASSCLLGAAWPWGIANASLIVSNDRPYWRFCNKCQVLFSTDADFNVCAAHGKHVPQGYEFRLPYDVSETRTTQGRWRACKQCRAMFFDGYRVKGRCPGGGEHMADHTFRYALPHDVPGTPTAQTDWRFCGKCYAMFYDGYPAKGVCSAGAGHVAQGYNFVLPHPR